jgi:outer membrane lipoprotein-sorting protein
MTTRFWTVLALGLCLVGGSARADDRADAKALLDKAIKAMNGEEKLVKLGTASVKGKMTGKAGDQEVTLLVDGIWQGPSQYRADVDISAGGNNIKGLMVVNGAKGWLKTMDRTEEAPEATAAFFQNLFHAARMPVLLTGLGDKAYTPTILAETKVGTRPAAGLLLSHKDRKDVTLYFDKENGLLLKSEVRLTDPTSKEITIEFHYGDYRDFDGVKLCGKITVKVDDKEFTMEVNEIKPLEKVEASQFEKP